MTGLANGPAAEAGEVVFLCVPFRSQSETLTNLKAHLREGQLLVDATVPLAAAVSGKATRTLGVRQGSAAQQADEMVPDGVRVVAALHTVNAPCSPGPRRDARRGRAGLRRPPADKAHAAALIELIPGLRRVDAGRLEIGSNRRVAHGAADRVNARYKTHAGDPGHRAARPAVVVLLGGRAPAARSSRAGCSTSSARTSS